MSARTVRHLSSWTVVIGLAVLGGKLAAWYLTGSVALFSDAMESIINVVASGMVWYAIRVSYKPADENHPFGHYKAEYLAAVVEGVLILFAAAMIAYEAVGAMFAPRLLEALAAGVAVNVLASLGNGIWAVVLMHHGRAARSPALTADGYHLWTDVITSVSVVIGLLLAVATGWLWLDPLLALAVAASIIWHGWHLVSSSVSGLMDAAMEPEDRARVGHIIAENSMGALEFHDLKTREAGLARFIEFHLVVPSDMTVKRSHEICDRIEEALEGQLPGVRVTIHVEPTHKAKKIR